MTPGQMTVDDLTAVAHHPVHDKDRNRIDNAIRADGRANDGAIDQARVRASLSTTWPNGNTTIDVSPRLLSARYSVLRAQGHIARDGWHINTSKDGGNGGRMYPTWRLTDVGWAVAE
jgi:hypothetical protein